MGLKMLGLDERTKGSSGATYTSRKRLNARFSHPESGGAAPDAEPTAGEGPRCQELRLPRARFTGVASRSLVDGLLRGVSGLLRPGETQGLVLTVYWVNEKAPAAAGEPGADHGRVQEWMNPR